MKKLTYLLAAAALSGGLALAVAPASATPLSTGLNLGNAAVLQMDEGMVQKVHGWHCRKRWSKHRGWHRHRRACYDDDYYYGYGGYPYGGYGFGFPFFSFGFYDDDHHHWRGHRHHKRRFHRKRRHHY